MNKMEITITMLVKLIAITRLIVMIFTMMMVKEKTHSIENNTMKVNSLVNQSIRNIHLL